MHSINISEDLLKQYIFRTLDFNRKQLIFKSDLLKFLKDSLKDNNTLTKETLQTVGLEDDLITYERFLA